MIKGWNPLLIIPIISETKNLLVLYISGISTIGVCSVYYNYTIKKNPKLGTQREPITGLTLIICEACQMLS